MNTYVVEKHWWFWVGPIILSMIFLFTIVIPIFILIWAALRWKFDKIEIKDGCLYSRIGIINIDKKTIPLEKISMINEKSDIISQWLDFGVIEIQSSAFGKSIQYPCIKHPVGLIEFYNKSK